MAPPMAALDRLETLPARTSAVSRPGAAPRARPLPRLARRARERGGDRLALGPRRQPARRATPRDVLTSIARITGLLSAYLALIQVVLLARLPALERLVGFDRLTVWHRWNGHACIDLVVAHVVFSVWGYALLDRFSLGKEISTMLGGGIYPGMITATVGTGLLIAVVATSVVIVRRRLRYEWWYAVHLARVRRDRARVVPPDPDRQRARPRHGRRRLLARALRRDARAARRLPRRSCRSSTRFRYRLRVAEVVARAPASSRCGSTGRGLDRLRARAGQFFLWRFLARGRWWSAHPFSLSRGAGRPLAAHHGQGARRPRGRLGAIPRRHARRRRGAVRRLHRGGAARASKVLLIAGGIGITPVRALIEEMRRRRRRRSTASLAEEDVVFRDELDELAADRGLELHYLVGDHATDEGARPAHARSTCASSSPTSPSATSTSAARPR